MRTRSEKFVAFEGGGHAFITGVPDKCEHNSDLTVFELSNGTHVFEDKYRCPTDEATREYIEASHKSEIVGGTTACSKCRKIFTLKDLMGDAYWL